MSDPLTPEELFRWTLHFNSGTLRTDELVDAFPRCLIEISRLQAENDELRKRLRDFSMTTDTLVEPKEGK